jgi:hypothetical protein
MTTNFFSPLSFVAVFGSGIRDPGSGMGKNQDPGSGINIPDPQHCLIPILRRFRIIRHQRQAALHSTLFNYTPLVIRGTDKNKQLTIA